MNTLLPIDRLEFMIRSSLLMESADLQLGRESTQRVLV